MRGVGSLASIFLSSSEHLVYEQDKLGNKQKIESPLPGLTGPRQGGKRGLGLVPEYGE